MRTLLAILLASALAAASAAPTALARGLNDGYVGCSYSDNCIALDLTTYAVTDTIDLIPEADYPYDATMRPDGSEVWFCGASGDGVIVIERATNTITHRIPVQEYPNSVVFTDNDSLALVSARDGDLVTLINTSTYTVVGTLDVTTGSGGTYDGPGNMALDPVSKCIYAIDWFDDYIFEIAPDASSVLRSVQIGDGVWQLVVDPFGRYIYVTDRSTDEIRVIDQATLTQVRAISVGDDPWGIDVTLDGSKLVVACEDDSNVHIINTSDWSVTILALDAGADPRDVDILDSEHWAFVAGGKTTATNPVYVVDLLADTLKSTIDVPASNANVIAVQAQMTSAMTGIPGPGPAAAALRLECYPNPFNPKMTIRYHLPETASVEVAVYDVSGRRVAVLDAGERSAGDHELFWDGVNDAGSRVATGVYFVRLEAGARTCVEKTALVK